MYKLRSLLIALLIALFLFAIRPAHGDFFLYPMKHVKTMVICAKATNCNAALNVMNKASAHIKGALNLSFDIAVIAMLPDEMSGDPETRMDKWLLRTKALREKYQVGATIVFLSPFPTETPSIDFETEEVYGMAAIASAGQVDSLAWLRLTGNSEIDYKIACHEIGHLMGGTHTNGQGFMSWSINQLEYTDRYSIESITEMQEYIAQLP